MAQKLKKSKNRTRTDCAKCQNCLMIIRDPTSIFGKYQVVCKKIPESMRYGSHYEGTIVPRYCSMYADKTIDMMYYTTRGEQ